MVLAQWAIHSGLVVPNEALLPVHEVHQLVVVYIAVRGKSISDVSDTVKDFKHTWVPNRVASRGKVWEVTVPRPEKDEKW